MRTRLLLLPGGRRWLVLAVPVLLGLGLGGAAFAYTGMASPPPPPEPSPWRRATPATAEGGRPGGGRGGGGMGTTLGRGWEKENPAC